MLSVKFQSTNSLCVRHVPLPAKYGEVFLAGHVAPQCELQFDRRAHQQVQATYVTCGYGTLLTSEGLLVVV